LVKEDIIAGLKNAVERGYSLQSAIQSFVSAGYNVQEVNEAAKQINMGVIGNINQNNPSLNQTSSQDASQSLNQTSSIPAVQNISKASKEDISAPIPIPELQSGNRFQKLPTISSPLIDKIEPKKGLPVYLIVLIVLLVIMVLGATFFYFFGQQIIDALTK